MTDTRFIAATFLVAEAVVWVAMTSTVVGGVEEVRDVANPGGGVCRRRRSGGVVRLQGQCQRPGWHY
ncbi:hypothetical protein HMPREF9607_00688 [Cutibacterium modestum HL044PA1]|uniref:Secreted protein n=1 Tax=Cutibacterium modestum HL044PA1 TaxID=765109 RepID=A0ABN0C757_9ACTN|nr:hypothetical protein HMPREF9607_00688 [Cutibacterium modestum HL044PA1]